MFDCSGNAGIVAVGAGEVGSGWTDKGSGLGRLEGIEEKTVLKKKKRKQKQLIDIDEEDIVVLKHN